MSLIGKLHTILMKRVGGAATFVSLETTDFSHEAGATTSTTVTKFDTSINRLKEYIRSCYHRDDIMLAELDGQFIRDFDFWLKTDKHCQNNSALNQ
jgi:hypothetical protein